MSIKFACSCGKAYKVPEKFAGKRVRCKQCGEPVLVPSTSAPISSARAAAVSQRSVMGSGRHKQEDDEDDDEADEDSAPRQTKMGAQSARLAGAAKDAGRVAAPTRRSGGDTQQIDPIDIMAEAKKYQKKRDDEGLARGVGKLTLFGPDGKAAKSFRIEKAEKTLGRGSKNDIQLEPKSVSKEHLRIEYKMGTYIAADAGSLNGVIVNGKQVRRASLKDGDLIQLGEAILRFEVGKPATP